MVFILLLGWKRDSAENGWGVFADVFDITVAVVGCIEDAVEFVETSVTDTLVLNVRDTKEKELTTVEEVASVEEDVCWAGGAVMYDVDWKHWLFVACVMWVFIIVALPETLAIFDADTFNNGGVGLAQPLDTTGADNPHDDIMVVTAGELRKIKCLFCAKEDVENLTLTKVLL